MEKAVRELKGEEVVEEITPEIHFHLPAFIPEAYVEDPGERLSLYRRLSLSRSEERRGDDSRGTDRPIWEDSQRGGSSPGSDQSENSPDEIVH